MFWKKGNSVFNSLRFKLTVWFSLIFGVIFFVLFVIIRIYISNYLLEQTDLQISNEIKSQSWLGNAGRKGEEQIRFINKSFSSNASQGGIENVFYLYLDISYTIIAHSSLEHWQGLKLDSANIPYLPHNPTKAQIQQLIISAKQNSKICQVKPSNHKFRSHTIFQTLQVDGRDDAVRLAFQHFNNNKLLISGMSLRSNTEFSTLIDRIFLNSFGALLVIIVIMVNLLTRRTLIGVEKVKNTAIGIGKSRFNNRVPIKNEATEIKSLAIAFNNMLERIENLMTEQKEMTHGIAHDLRSPLTSIRGITETTLGNNPTLSDYEQMAGKVICNCDRLIHLINSMLDISDIESGNYNVMTSELDLQLIINECVEVYQPIASDKNIELKYEHSDSLIKIRGNRQLLQRALGNIVDNAIKFSTQGGHVSLIPELIENKVHIRISDMGIGISENELKHIFERFYQVDKNRTTEGNGLGVSLAKAYIEYQKGAIEVESKVSSGTTFTIILPII